MRRGLPILACAGALALSFSASAASADTVGSVPWVRTAATKVITAELARDGATACGVLNAPLTSTVAGKTCAQRWTARADRLLAKRGGARHLRADLAAVNAASITINGLHASIALPYPLLDGQSRFYWTNMCWMLAG